MIPQRGNGQLRVLVIARAKSSGVSPFVEEQVRSLRELDVSVDVRPLRGRTVNAYSWLMWYLGTLSARERPDLVHAHFGLTGLVSTFQDRFPVVVTFHGSDINNPRVRRLSRLAARRASANIVVSQDLASIAGFKRAPEVIPCGIDLETFYPEDYEQARKELGFGSERVVVFPSGRGRWVKNFELAERAITQLPVKVRLVELSGFTRDGVRKLLSAADVLLMTSRSEGSPQVVKEALATGCPVVSTDVGDVREMIGSVQGCYVTSYELADIVSKLEAALISRRRVSCGNLLERISSRAIAKRLLSVYESVLK